MPSSLEARIAAALGLLLACLPGDLHGSPRVPGAERLSASPDASSELLGEVLIGELSCVRCHQSDSPRLRMAQAPDLSRIGSRATPAFLRSYLASPHAAREGALMPDLLHSRAPSDRDRAVEELVHFLVSLDGPMPPPESGGTQRELEWGQELFHSVGCVACHGPQEGEAVGEEYVSLPDLAAKTTIDSLSRFLLDPHSARPAGRMPSLWLEEDEARAISVYLLRRQLDAPGVRDGPPVSVPGLEVEYYELDSVGRLPDFSELEPVRKGDVESVTLETPFERRSNNFALRFLGELRLEEGGSYEFATISDDGSLLIIDGEEVVDNDGTHGMQSRQGRIDLASGSHSFELQYFNAGGPHGLVLRWRRDGQEGPPRQVPESVFYRTGGLPMEPAGYRGFAVDPLKAEAGRLAFREAGCASCHQLEGHSSALSARPLSELDASAGCLASPVRAGLPDYRLDERQRGWIRAALDQGQALSSARAPADAVRQQMAAYNCYACHDRDGIGGAAEELANEFFGTFSEIDLGDEGRIPPNLQHAGSKLKPEALESILVSRDLHVRDYMKVRMPRFGIGDPAALADAFVQAEKDRIAPTEWTFREEDVAVGRQFVGTNRGFACITCHNIAGQEALAIPGVDIASAYDRLNREWFEQFMLDPGRFIPRTRMPQFWPGGFSLFQDVHGGDATRQIQSVWAYLSLGNALPLPEGIVVEGGARMEIVPMAEVVVHRTFMEGAGPRAILAGYPERVNAAFDGNVVRLAKIWRGRFFDQSGVESGRTDAFLGPLGEDVLDMPPGPAFAQLDSPEAPWPAASLESRDLGGDFLGYFLDDDGRPVFRYRLGGVEIRETPVPVLRPGGGTLRRSFRLEGDARGSLHLLAAQGDSVEALAGENAWRVGEEYDIRIEGSPPPRSLRRSSGGQQQVLVPVALDAEGRAGIEIWIQW